MLYTGYLNQRNSKEVEEITNFLSKYGVKYDQVEKTVVVRDKGIIVGTGSCDSSILKYLFIDPSYKGQGLMVDIYNKLLDYLLEKGRLGHFVFTTPNNEEIFTSIGLDKVIATNDVLLLEGGFSSYDKWMENIKNNLDKNVKIRGAIVANCNPMTLGHKYLIEYSRSKVEELIVFIVEEDRSFFSTKDRFNIVREELKNEDHIIVCLGGPYIISQATFPTYFLKEEDDKLDIYTELDGTLFAERIAKDLQIQYRFVGEEPIDKVTKRYNYKMKEVFKNYPIELEVIERKEFNGQVISASRVRKLLDDGNIEEAMKLVPEATQKFIKSGEFSEKNS